MLKGLVKLIRYMDGLSGPADLQRIDQLLREADVDRDDLVQACNFNDVNYARTMFSQSPWYQLLVICWRRAKLSDPRPLRFAMRRSSRRRHCDGNGV